MSKRILFFGNERLATGVTTSVPVLQGLLAAGYEVPAVVVAQNQLAKSRQARQLEIAGVAGQHNIKVLAPVKLSEMQDELASFEAEAAVLVAFGKIVPQAIIDLFPSGILNIHPSLLPKHRGPTPIESVILNGEKETGVSIMKLAAEMDAGPVYAQETVLLHGQETKQQLTDQLLEMGRDMLLQHLPAILAGELRATEQSDAEASYDKRIDKSASELDFRAKSAEELCREVRAYAGWPRSWAVIGPTKVTITQASPLAGSGTPGTLWLEGGQLGIYAKNGILLIDKLIPAGKKEMSGQAFLAGYKPTP